MADETVYKRRRVSRACDRCRAIKAKCDGKQPICGRCSGYGHDCRWEKGRKGTLSTQAEPSDPESVQQIWQLNSKIHRLSTMLRNVRDEVSENSRTTMDEVLAAVRTKPKPESVNGRASSPVSQQDDAASERFLGEASDIVFYNTVKQSFHVRSPASGSNIQGSPEIVEASYEQHKPTQSPKHELSSIMPSRAAADRYLDVYFSTIHIAYPFLSQKLVEEAHSEWWQKGTQSVFSQADIWLSLMLTIYAIGACYECFSGADVDTSAREDRLHHRLFDQASAVLNRKEPRRHLDFVATTLVQCFYLLATSQTDRCWAALGVAVRTSQAIGLHTESSSSLRTRQVDAVLIDKRRRTWYSVYVLDRLLALQLGRPPAIHDSFYNTALPMPAQEYRATPESIDKSHERESRAGVEDYFTAMINFSHLIGEVLEQLYGPHKTDLLQKTMSIIQSCDQKLLQWRTSLPRRLRFDLGHTFDSSLMFKRQRNMLAIKFYHLRSLIYRPCVALSSHATWASTPTETFSAERQSILMSKRLCITSAQSTARLLYGLEGKQNLVHDFPWWQMISCLICASSILLVARLDIDHDELVRHLNMGDVEEDAEVCLKVFAALSTNSNAARLARDMMRGLKESRVHSQERSPNGISKEKAPKQLPSSEISLTDTLLESTQRLPSMTDPSTLQYWTLGMPVSDDFGYTDLPNYNEISEPLLWSAQFVNAEYNPFLNSGYEDVDLT